MPVSRSPSSPGTARVNGKASSTVSNAVFLPEAVLNIELQPSDRGD